MADFRFFYCIECGAMNFFWSENCNICKSPRLNMVAFYFDELDHVEFCSAPKLTATGGLSIG